MMVFALIDVRWIVVEVGAFERMTVVEGVGIGWQDFQRLGFEREGGHFVVDRVRIDDGDGSGHDIFGQLRGETLEDGRLQGL